MPHFADRALIISHPALSLLYLSNLVRSDQRLSTFTDVVAKEHLSDLIAIKTVDLHQSLNRFCLLRIACVFLIQIMACVSTYFVFISPFINTVSRIFFIRRFLQLFVK